MRWAEAESLNYADYLQAKMTLVRGIMVDSCAGILEGFRLKSKDEMMEYIQFLHKIISNRASDFKGSFKEGNLLMAQKTALEEIMDRVEDKFE